MYVEVTADAIRSPSSPGSSMTRRGSGRASVKATTTTVRMAQTALLELVERCTDSAVGFEPAVQGRST